MSERCRHCGRQMNGDPPGPDWVSIGFCAECLSCSLCKTCEGEVMRFIPAHYECDRCGTVAVPDRAGAAFVPATEES